MINRVLTVPVIAPDCQSLTRRVRRVKADFGVGFSSSKTTIIKSRLFWHLPRWINPLIPFDFHLR
jgi:hypothetical protein